MAFERHSIFNAPSIFSSFRASITRPRTMPNLVISVHLYTYDVQHTVLHYKLTMNTPYLLLLQK